MLIPFDILYEGFCNGIRSANKTDHVLQIMKSETNDLGRINTLLHDEPDLLSLLSRNISDCFEPKDEIKSRQLWKRGVDGKSLVLLTEAISRCPVAEFFEEKVVPAFVKQSSKVLLQSFMECGMKEGGEEPGVMASIFYDRACILLSRNRHACAFKDFIRAWLLGFSKSLDLTYRIAVCSYECGELDNAKELLQCTAQHLRTLEMSNEQKSEWTMNIVKALKAIEAIRKASSGSKHANKPRNMESTIDSSKCLSCNEEIQIFAKLHDSASEAIDVASKAIALAYTPEKGRHMIATENIPAGR